jgi:alkylhydroperoxidase family enzyme
MTPEPAWITTVDETEATGKTAEAYEKIANSQTGRVGHILKVSSLNPRAMVDHRALYRTLMFGPSPLKRYQREMIATVVSAINGCHY